MDFDHLLAGGVVVGLLASCWSRVRLLAWRLVNLLVCRVRVDQDAAPIVSNYLWTTLTRSPFGEKRYAGGVDYVRPVGRSQHLLYELLGTDVAVFWRGWFPILVSFSLGETSPQGHSIFGTGLYLTYLRFTFDAEQLLVAAVDEFNRIQSEGSDDCCRFDVRRVFGRGRLRSSSLKRGGSDGPPDRPTGAPAAERYGSNLDRRYLKWDRSEIGPDRGRADPFNALAYPPEVLELVEEAQRWKLSENWYKERQIPWRRGWLLTGPPGTGKTSLAVAVARSLDLPIIAFDLATFGNEDLVEEWDQLLSRAPCIALLEDLDAVFDGRENRLGEQGGGLTFDCLLNCISGARNSDGIIVIVTTNHPERLDPALGAPERDGMPPRPGRIDRAVALGVLDEACRHKIAVRILADCLHLVDETVAAGGGDTGAQFQERCARLALEQHWRPDGRRERAARLDADLATYGRRLSDKVGRLNGVGHG